MLGYTAMVKCVVVKVEGELGGLSRITAPLLMASVEEKTGERSREVPVPGVNRCYPS